MLVLDTEDNTRGEVMIINFFDGAKHYTFKGGKMDGGGMKEFQYRAWDWLGAHGKDYCWAVNCEYDLINLFGTPWLGRAVTLQYVASGLMRAFFQGHNGTTTFLDTFRHWPVSVERMGQELGFPKSKMPHWGCDCSKCVAYCQRDCEVTYRYIEQMLERYEFLGLKLRSTLPSMAMQLFKKFYAGEFMTYRPQVEKMFRDAYYGGRVEVFRYGKIDGPINHYDVNSLFPSVMSNHRYPVLSSWFRKRGDPNLDGLGVCRAAVKVPEAFLTCLPVRHETEILFPYGTFEGCWTYAELKSLIEHGGDFVPIESIEFADYEQPFDRYVDFCYRHRLRASSDIDKTFWKLMLNSLYGKFGQSRGITTIYSDRTTRGVVEREIPGKSKTSNVIWSAYVTSYARLRLLSYLESCKQVFYTDTDSVFTPDTLDTSSALGALKSEGVYKVCEFIGNKIYAVDGKAKAKGVRAKDKTSEGVETFPAADFIRTGRAVYRRPMKFRESRRTGGIANFWYNVEKKHSKPYTKRIVNPDGSTQAWEYGHYKKHVESLQS